MQWTLKSALFRTNILSFLDSSFQSKQQQSLKFLQLLVYTAAKTDARQFIEMIFSTSAGQIVFNSYKDRTPLPEDVARANGHEELAQYLLDVHTRYSVNCTHMYVFFQPVINIYLFWKCAIRITSRKQSLIVRSAMAWDDLDYQSHCSTL